MKKISMKVNLEDMSIKDAFNIYIRKCIVKNLSKQTITTYKVHYAVFEKYYGTETLIVNIEENMIDNFILYLRDNNECNDVIINSYLRTIRAFLYFLMDAGYIDKFTIHITKVDKKLKPTYTEDELKLLLKKPNVKKCDFIEYRMWVFSNYLLGTGNRISSALNLLICDIDFGCDAQTPSRKTAVSYSEETKASVENRKKINKAISSYDLLVQQLNSLVTHSFGVYKTDAKQPDGTVIYYMHDKPTLETSVKIWKQTIDAFAVSTDGGVTYTAGFDVEGNAVVNFLSAIGINADWVRLGKLLSTSGATLIDMEKGIANSDNFGAADNVANGYPLKIPFNIDANVSEINQVLLKWTIDKFRTYSTTASSGGGTSTTSATGESMIVVSPLTGNFSTEVAGGKSTSTGPKAALSGGSHTHTYSVDDHSHNFSVNHGHIAFDNGHSHSFSTPSHTHGLNFGIMETSVSGNTIEIYIDDVLRATANDTQGIVNLTTWITTPGWHLIEMRSTTLKRISAQISIKSYIHM